MDDFFKPRSYCDNCPIEVAVKKGKLELEKEKCKTTIVSDTRNLKNLDYLFLTDTVEIDKYNEALSVIIKRHSIKNYAIIPAIGCAPKDVITNESTFPKPIYATFNYCNSFNIEDYNPKVVIALGRSLMYFTKSSVFSSWREFREFIFNPTYFYPHIKSKWKGRIYPAGYMSNILLDFKSFEYNHFCKQLNFVKKHIENYENEKFVMPNWKIKKIEDVDSFMVQHELEKEVAADTETSSLNVFEDTFRVGSVQLSFDGLTGYYIPIQNIKNKRGFSVWLDKKKQIWANGKYDAKALKREKIFGVHVDEDIPLIFHLMNTERDSNSIKVLAWLVGFGGYEDELEEYIKKYKTNNYLEIPEKVLMPYAGLDGIVTYRLKEYLHKYLVPKQSDTYELYRKYVLPVIPVFQSMEEEGILVDKLYVEKYHKELMIRKEKVEKEIYELASTRFNIASNDELGKILEKLGLPDYGRVKKGLYQTGEEILNKWKVDGFEIAIKILEYRKITKLDNTYVGNKQIDNSDEEVFFNRDYKKASDDVEGIYQYVMSDGRIHGNIAPALTDSWRSLSFNPNLQNYPKRGKEGKEFRQVFIAPEDYLFCEADYSGFQLRLMAMYSNDKEMLDGFNTIGDLHSVTAQAIFAQNLSLEEFMQKKKEDPYKTARYNGKVANLAFAFNFTPFSFQNKIKEEWSREQIDKYIKENKSIDIKENDYLTVANDLYEKFFKKYHRLRIYMLETQKKAAEQGYINCPLSEEFSGLRRHLPELMYEGKRLSKEKLSHYSKLKNIAVNAGAQGGEAIIVYKSLIKIYNKIKELGLKSKLIGCVHDSLVLYVHKNEIQIIYKLLKENMEIFDYKIPILADVEVGEIWGFGKEVES